MSVPSANQGHVFPDPLLPLEKRIQVLFFALVIIGIIGLAVAGMGAASYGAQHGLWSVGALNLPQIYSFVMIGVGGSGGLLLISVGVIGSIKNYIRQLHQCKNAIEDLVLQIKEANNATADATTQKDQETQRAERAERRVHDIEQNNGILSLRNEQQAARIHRLELERQQLQEQTRQKIQRAERAERRVHDIEQNNGILSLRNEQQAARIHELELERQQLQEQTRQDKTTSQPILRVGRAEQVWKVFNYNQIAEQKYWTVLEQYVRHLSFTKLCQLMDIVSKKLCSDSNNEMLLHLKKMLLLLQEPQQDARTSYQLLIRELRAVINSREYKNSDDLLRSFVHTFCLVRWQGTHLYDYLEDTVRITIRDNSSPKLTADNFSRMLLSTNAQIKSQTQNKKPFLALEKQKLSGALGTEDFCGWRNTPHLRNVQTFRNKQGKQHQLLSVRHGSPTALGNDYYTAGVGIRKVGGLFARLWNRYAPESVAVGGFNTGEEVTADYEEYLIALESQKQSVLFCVHQRRTADVFEDERTRVMKIEELQKKHPNIHVLTQPVEGDLFQHRGAYRDMCSFNELKQSLEQEFFDTDSAAPTTRASLPAYFLDSTRKEHYRAVFKKLMEDIQEIFFPGESNAIDKSLLDSNLSIELDEAYCGQIESIKDQALKADLSTLERVDDLVVEGSVITKIMTDNTFIDSLMQRIQDQIKTYELLIRWIPAEMVNSALSIEKNLENENIYTTLIYGILGTVAHINLETSRDIEALEEKEGAFLEKWQSFIFLVYAFQKLDLKCRLNGVGGFSLASFTGPCKDYLDRGGAQAVVEEMLILYMLGMENEASRLEEVFYNLLGPPILVKKKEAIPRRIIPALKVVDLFNKMQPAARERLAAYTFTEEEWRVAGCEVPHVKGQTSVPSIPRLIRQGIEEITGKDEDVVEKITSLFRQFVGLDFGQWQDIDLSSLEKDYIEQSLFVESKIKQQVERELKCSITGVKYELITPDNRVSIDSYNDLKAELEKHPVVGQNQEKVLKILSAFHQGIAAEAYMLILNALGKGAVLFRLQNKKPQPGEVVRFFELDLTQNHQIVFRFSELYDLFECEGNKPLVEFKTHVEVVYQNGSGDDNKLYSQPAARWVVTSSMTGDSQV